jgi:putative oxidoreductase
MELNKGFEKKEGVKVFRKLISTKDDFAATLARIALGAVMLPHGLQKLVGLFGGYGFSGTMEALTSSGIPYVAALLVILGESFGALGLIVGFISRFAAFGIMLTMLGAVFMVHRHVGFFMNWTGKQNGEGYEFHLLAIGLALIVMLRGAGKWSIDRALSR